MANEVTIKVVAEDHASGPIQRVRNSVSELALGFGTGLVATQALSAAFGFLGGQVTSSVRAFQESEVAVAKLNAVLKATGGVAGVSADEAQRLATQFQRLTGTSDEAILDAQSVLLTFKQIGSEVFPEATRAALDLSTVFGQDLHSSALQLGKALNEPVEGVSALRRVGVQLTDQQEEMIKKFVELGEVGKAQAVILGEIQAQVGGAAEAFGQTATGKIAIFNQSVDDMKERLGAALGDGLLPLVDRLIAWTQTDDAERFVDSLAKAFGAAATAIVFTVEATDDVVRVFSAFTRAAGEVIPLGDQIALAFRTVKFAVDEVSQALDAMNGRLDSVGVKLPSISGGGAKGVVGDLLGVAENPIGAAASGLGALVKKFIPGRADGGAVSAGMPFLVGERGPELFVPRGSGSVLPNGRGGVAQSIDNSIHRTIEHLVIQAGATQDEVVRALERADEPLLRQRRQTFVDAR